MGGLGVLPCTDRAVDAVHVELIPRRSNSINSHEDLIKCFNTDVNSLVSYILGKPQKKVILVMAG